MSSNIILKAIFPDNSPFSANVKVTPLNLIKANVNLYKQETDPIYTADKPDIAFKTDLPTKVSDLNNDSDFATNDEVDTKIAAIPTPDVSGQISTHNTSGTAHTEIRNSITSLNSALNTESTNRQNADNVSSNAISLKANKTDVYTKTESDNLLAGKADNSDIPTKISELTNDSSFATTSQVNTAIQNVIGTAPSNLDTLQEIATQLSSDESAVAAITTTLATKAANSDLSAETSARQNANNTLTSNLNAEITARQNADTTLTNNLSAEIDRAKAVETVLGNAIASEITRAQNVEDSKVDKEGYVATEENYTTEEKNKLKDIEAGAQANTNKFTEVILGNGTTEGGWKIVIVNDTLSFQRLESGIWTEKGAYTA